MAGFIGLNECLEHDVTASGTWLAFDKVESGTLDYDGGDVEENEGIGGQVAYYRGMVVPTGNVSTMLQTLTLLSCVKPASIGALPTVIKKIQGGPIVTANAARLHEDCYLNNVKVKCEVGGPVMVDYSWMALTETEKTTIASAAAKQTNSPVMWHDADVDVNGAAYKCQSWEVEIVNSITPQTSQDTKVAGNERMPEWFDPGSFRVNINAVVRVDPGFDFSAKFPGTFEFAFVGSDNEAVPKTFTVDCASGGGFQLQGDPIPLVRGSEAVLYQVRGTSLNDLSIINITFA